MHLLFLTSLLPEDRPASGFDIATDALIRGFEDCGTRITVAGFRRPNGAAPRAGRISLGDLEIENAGAGTFRKAAWVAEALRKGLPVSAAKLAVHGSYALRKRLEAAGRIDGVVLNSVQMPAAYPFLQDLAPSIFVAHNVEHLSASENAANARSSLARALYRREARLLRPVETAICARANAVLTFSDEDRRRLDLGVDGRAVTAPLTVGRPQPAGDDGPRVREIGLIGTWSWAPNRVGLDWFLGEVVPLLPPDFQIEVAGRFDGSPPSAPANVRFVGRVPDAQVFVRGSRVVALATRGGTGVQLKTIETLEEGMPAVATSSALRGIGAALPFNVRLADDPHSFAAALAELVAADRGGDKLRCDGEAFAVRQSDAMHAAIRASLARIGRGPATIFALDAREAKVMTDGEGAPVPARAAGAPRR